MRKLMTAVLLATATAVAAQSQDAGRPQVKQFTLKNGMTVWVNEDHTQPKVFGAVVVKAGAKDCPGTGIAHYFEHIMFKGTRRLGTTDFEKERPWLDSISAQYDLLSQTKDENQRTAIQAHINELSIKASEWVIPNEFNRLIALYGGTRLNAYTSFDQTVYHNVFLPQYLRQWCYLNAERMINPVFRMFQGELETVYEEKNRASDIIGDATDKLFSALFKDQPYGQPIIGTTENLKNPRLSDMEAFYRQYYVASNMGLILCGDIDANGIEALLEATFGRIADGPVAARKKSPMPPIEPGQKVDILLPIPLIKAQAVVLSAPTDYDDDAIILDLANSLLTNGKAGYLDSLSNEHHVLAALAERTALSDAAGQVFLVIPKLPFGKKQKAMNAVWRQVERIKRGDFSDQRLEELRSQALIELERELEAIDKRAAMMIDAFANDQPWATVTGQIERLKKVTREDIVRVANKYYTDNYITFVKRYGTGNKEVLKQPGYKPVEPKNAGARSEAARELAQMPMSRQSLRTVDIEKDAERIELTPHATLFAVPNPMNDIFTLSLRYLNGSHNTPLLTSLKTYLCQAGTDSLKKQQLEAAWLSMGCDLDIKCDERTFAFTISGREQQMEKAMHLLCHVIRHAKADDEALKEVKDEAKLADKSVGKTKDDVLLPLISYVAYGKASPFLNHVSLKDIRKTTSEDLLALLDELQLYDCQLTYCGTRKATEVALLAKKLLPVNRSEKAPKNIFLRPQTVDKPTVYFYHVPKSRQNNVISYETLAPVADYAHLATAQLWSRYVGGGMSSVLFQNVREYRSMAYSTQSLMPRTDTEHHPDTPLPFFTVTGTQADKTMQVVALVDSLLRNLPMNAENIAAARQELLNEIQSKYPTFRDKAGYVADIVARGHDKNPETPLSNAVMEVSDSQIETLQREQTAQNQRVWVVVGDRKQIDFKALQHYGNVVELKKADIYK